MGHPFKGNSQSQAEEEERSHLVDMYKCVYVCVCRMTGSKLVYKFEFKLNV